MGVERSKAEVAAQYVDHNLLQTDELNADDHLFLLSACRRFGIWYSRPGNGISHPVHMQRFGVPGKTLVGSDSHTPAAGSLGMLAFGAGGLEVALAMAGEPLHIRMPQIWGVRLTGQLPAVGQREGRDPRDAAPPRRGGRLRPHHRVPRPGPRSASPRWTATSSPTWAPSSARPPPSSPPTRRSAVSCASEGRGDDWVELVADAGAGYDVHEEIDLSRLEPLIAKPSSPGNVVPVREVAGEEIYQAYIGSSANPGFRDFAIAALIVAAGRCTTACPSTSTRPRGRSWRTSSREGLLAELMQRRRAHPPGRLQRLHRHGPGARRGRNSLRTMPRNFPGRSGTREDGVFLCSPETAAASALTGRHHRPARPRHDLPRGGVARAARASTPPCSCRRCPRRRRGRSGW